MQQTGQFKAETTAIVMGMFCLALSLFIAPLSTAQRQVDSQAALIREKFMVSNYRLQRLKIPAAALRNPNGEFSVSVALGGRRSTLDFKHHSNRAPNFTLLARGADGALTAVPAPVSKTYRGTIRNSAGQVAASIIRGQLNAQVFDGKQTWWIQPLSDAQPGAAADMYVTFRQTDAVPGNWRCGLPDGGAVGLPKGGIAQGPPPLPGCLQQAQIAFDADFDYYLLLEATLPPPPLPVDVVQAVSDDIDMILNMVNFIYERDCAITHLNVQTVVQTVEPDPYTSTNPGTLLVSFQNEWNANQGGLIRDVAHLMTGKEIDGGVIGIAYLPGVCTGTEAYGLSQSRFTSNLSWRTRLTAHELGHNWAAPHCNADPLCSIMCTSVGGCIQAVDEFEPGTAGIIINYRDSIGCLQDAAPADWSSLKFMPDDSLSGDLVGTSVAIDGNLAIVGEYRDDTSFNEAGSAYVYGFDTLTGLWEKQAKLIADDGALNDGFGVSVDIVDAGEFGQVAVVGAYLANAPTTDTGAAYVFRKVQGAWVQETKLLASDIATSDLFGRSVSIVHVDDSETILIGSFQDDDTANNSGAGYIFRKTGGAWFQETKLNAVDPDPSDGLGIACSLAVSPFDGTQYAIMGAWRDDDNVTDSGSAYIFRKSGSGWSEVAKLHASDPGSNDQFGIAVAIDVSDTAGVAVVGAWNNDSEAKNAGSAYVFRDIGTGWAQEAKLIAPDANINDHFGNSVGISGNVAIVGSYLDEGEIPNAGSVYMFQHDEFGWTFQQKKRASDEAENDQFGISVDINGDRAIVGCWQDDVLGLDAGAFYILTNGTNFIDCNNNGIADNCDIASGNSPDANADGIPDECQVPPCQPDTAPTGGNGIVNVDDLLTVINGWGPCPPPCPPSCLADIAPPGGNCVVNVDDLLAVINAWGACP